MMTAPDFEKKMLVFVFLNKGEKVTFSNDNLIVKTKDEQIRLQTTCYRVFALFIVGSFTLTTGIIQRAHKFDFPIFLLTQSVKIYDKLGHSMEGNVVLRKKQYAYSGLSIAKLIVKNKTQNQLLLLKNEFREKDELLKRDIKKISELISSVDLVENNLQELLGIEGNCAKIFFKHHFNNVEWNGRKPRVKLDYINSALDIGYSILFNLVDALLGIYGFDTYCGVLHKEFYMRKSLVSDLVEPFRVLIDAQVRKSINLDR